MTASLDHLAPTVLDEWHVVGALDEICAAGGKPTRLLGQPIRVDVEADGTVAARSSQGGTLRAIARFGYAWVSLGDPDHDLFRIPEYAEPDRRNINAATFGVGVSAPRAVENFLDMAHFPFVHTDILGEEAHSEVKDYDVEISTDPSEVLATRCRFYQPKAAANADGGAEVEYVYRVPHPYCAVLYKSNPLFPDRMDVIALFGQPVDEEEVEASLLLCLIDGSTSDTRPPGLPAAHLGAGQADPREPAAETAAARSARRNADPRRQVLDRLSALATPHRREFRDPSGVTPSGRPADLRSRWFPIAASEDLVPRHVFHGQLLKQELAVWRSDSGTVNVWENRCLHRGVRLSIGLNLGRELQCQYHGWRYADGTAACTYIPAHPANAPARTIRNRTYPALERCGLVWSRLDDRDGDLGLPDVAAAGPVLRAIPIEASADRVLETLAAFRFVGADHGRPLQATPIDPYAVRLTPEDGESEEGALLFVQPVDDNRCTLRGRFDAAPQVASARSLLRHMDQQLESLRDAVEMQIARDPALVAPWTPTEIPLSPPVLVIPDAERRPGAGTLTVRVRRKWVTAAGIVALTLEPIETALPPAIAGAHVDLVLPNGLVRQYSPIDPAGETGTLTLGVKREALSSGGSAALHESVREGDMLAIGPPHDNFPLRPADHHVLIAGGIGVTPLLAMARTLRAADRPHTLHLFARSAGHVPFADLLGGDAVLHLGLDAPGTAVQLAATLREPRPGDRLYVCGPAQMIAAGLAAAEAAGWPDERVHVEHFANTRLLDQGSTFEVALARSALTVIVPAERTIVDVLAEHGVHIPTSCSQGACGTCLVTVLDGEPDHRDVYLSRAEHASNTCMTPCVSRARSARLVLDI